MLSGTSIPDQSAGWCLVRMLSVHVSHLEHSTVLFLDASPKRGSTDPYHLHCHSWPHHCLFRGELSLSLFLSPLVPHPTFSYCSWNANRNGETVHGYGCVSWWLDSYLMFPSSFCGGQWQITQPHAFLPVPDLLRNHYLLETETGKCLKGQQENRLFR